jgi:hypothetical protein
MSESREVLLALTILFVLGAWAATAQDVELSATNELDLAKFGLSAKDNSKFDVDSLTFWKRVQLQAAAMSEPKALLSYSIGRSANLSDIVQFSSADTWQTALVAQGGMFKVGVIDKNGQFLEVANSASCASAERCEEPVWEALGQAASGNHGISTKVLFGVASFEEPPISASDLKVFWTADAETTDAWGTKVLLKATN